MNHEEKRRDDFLREVLRGQPVLAPPSTDFRQQIMQRVVAVPVASNHRLDLVLMVGGIMLALILVVGGGYWLATHGSVITQAVATAFRWLPFSVDPVWILIGLGYGLVARALLTIGVLATVHKKRMLVATQLG